MNAIETGRAAAQADDTWTKFPPPTTMDIVNTWFFAVMPPEWPQTLVMQVVSPLGDWFYVTYDKEAAAGQKWQAQCPAFHKHWAVNVIAAVKYRVNENRARRIGEAN